MLECDRVVRVVDLFPLLGCGKWVAWKRNWCYVHRNIQLDELEGDVPCCVHRAVLLSYTTVQHWYQIEHKLASFIPKWQHGFKTFHLENKLYYTIQWWSNNIINKHNDGDVLYISLIIRVCDYGFFNNKNIKLQKFQIYFNLLNISEKSTLAIKKSFHRRRRIAQRGHFLGNYYGYLRVSILLHYTIFGRLYLWITV